MTRRLIFLISTEGKTGEEIDKEAFEAFTKFQREFEAAKAATRQDLRRRRGRPRPLNRLQK